MSARSQILAAIRRNRPEAVAKPEIPTFDAWDSNPPGYFAAVLEKVGGRSFPVQNADEVAQSWREWYPGAVQVASPFPGWIQGQVDLSQVERPHELDGVDVAILPGEIGVAESAAVWVAEAVMGHRVLPFIAQHLILILHRTDLVWNLHEAYDRLGQPDTGFGVFISGPSKTADIEQSLVIGAQGPRSLTVAMVG